MNNILNTVSKDETTTVNSHDEFWHRTAENAASRVSKLFSESSICMKDVIGGDGVIRNYVDAKKALAYILLHSDNTMEKACGILSICEWLHACNELRERVAMDMNSSKLNHD